MSTAQQPHSSLCSFDDDIDEEDESRVPPAAVGQWFEDLTASLARTLKDSIPHTKHAFDDFAGALQRSATNLANELASFEREAGREARRWAENLYESEEDELHDERLLPLPWQIQEETEVFDESIENTRQINKTDSNDSHMVEDEQLKSEILALSTMDCTFTEPFNNYSDDATDENIDKIVDGREFVFELESHMNLIHRLLQIDLNLRSAHAKLSLTKVNEYNFWKNYFFHCATLREGRDVVKIDMKSKLDDKNLSNRNPSTFEKLSSTSDAVNSLREDQFIVGIDEKSYDSSEDFVGSFEEILPHTLSMGDLVLVGGGNEDLDKIAVGIPQLTVNES